MGRPLNKRYFGPLADADDPLNAPKNDTKFNVMAAVKVGTNTVGANGYILAQRSTTSFLVNDLANGTKRTIGGTGTGNVGVCRVVDKATPANNEMVITGSLPDTVLTGDIDDANWADDVITFESVAHGLEAGDQVVISGVTPSGYNGTYQVLAGPTANTFSVSEESDPGAYVSGGTFSSTQAGASVRIARLFNRTCRDFDNNRYKWATEEDTNITKLVLTPL